MARNTAVLSISSAQGWWALNLESGDACRLACFALLGDGRVIGLDSLLDPEFAPETSGEDRYAWLGDDPSEEDILNEVGVLRAELGVDGGS